MISEQYRFLFIHRPRSGGNSISTALLPYSEDAKVITSPYQDGVDRFSLESSKYGTTKHYTLAQYKGSIPPEIFEGLFKFSVLRNPFARLISAYFLPKRALRTGHVEFQRERFIALIEKQKRLRDFICTTEEGPILGEIDYLIPFEDLERGLEKVCESVGIPMPRLEKLNSSSREDYRSYYDAELRALVEQRFAEELEVGHYSF